jgi:hypothetical protein
VLFLTIAAARTGGFGSAWRREPGDRLRRLLAMVLVFCALPWIAAGWDLSLHLRSLFLTDQLRSQPGVAGLHHAVHAGFHHGWGGVMLVLTALLLSRSLPYLSKRIPSPRDKVPLGRCESKTVPLLGPRRGGQSGDGTLTHTRWLPPDRACRPT